MVLNIPRGLANTSARRKGANDLEMEITISFDKKNLNSFNNLIKLKCLM